jgi:histidine triad (HIT) family protein
MNDCIFCKIIKAETPTKLVYEDENVVAFSDLHPQAPTHLLIIPRQHIATLNDLEASHEKIISQMTHAAVKIAKEKKLEKDGYRLVMNCNQQGGQSVFHIHMHLLGGRQMTWPPG